MGKVLLILGGSSDLALNYIENYYMRYDVIIAQYHTHKDQLEELNNKTGGKLRLYQADLSVTNDVQGLIDYIKSNELFPDYVLHCPAGKIAMARISQFDSDVLYREMQIEVVSILSILKEVAPHMQEQKFGRICVVLSSVTESPDSFHIPYIVTKYALLGVVKALAAELAPKNITVNAVSPTMIETKYIEDTAPYAKQKMISMVPIKRLAVPADITRALDFFLSDENEYITGDNLLIGGGSYIIGD